MALEIKTYEKKPPKIEVIKVTRENYNEVAKHLGARVTANQGEFDSVQTITIHPNNGNDPLVFKIPVDLDANYEAYIRREIAPNNDKWEVIRQYDLAFGYSELTNNKENN